MDKFTAYFIPWNEWNKKLTILNSLNKAFYIEAKFYTKEEPDDSLFMDHDFYETRGHHYDNFVVHFSAKKYKKKELLLALDSLKQKMNFIVKNNCYLELLDG